jgi:glycosyltransferase involved in cell wall biosynthesis
MVHKKKFRIGFDLSPLDPGFREHAHRGTGRYARHIWEYLEKHQSPEVEFIPFTYRSLHQGVGFLEKCVSLLPRGRQTVKTQFLYPRALSRLPVDALYFSTHFDAPAWCKIPRIVSVLDLIPIILPDLFGDRATGLRFKFGRYLENSALRNASYVISISENTANDCVRVLGMKREDIAVTPLGIDARFSAKVDPVLVTEFLRTVGVGERDNYILAVGGIDPRKNIRTLIVSFKNLVERERFHGLLPSKLIFVGKIKVDDQYPLLQQLIKEYKLQNLVVEAGFVPDETLVGLYHRASVLFSPTRYEGFGLTFIEAMAAGCPVVCSDNSSILEAVEDAALVSNCFDDVTFGRNLYHVIHHKEGRSELISKGKVQASKFSWEKTGELTLQAFEEAARRIIQAQ